MELRVGENYRLGRRIGSGAFGDIYLGTHVIAGEEFAIKLEPVRVKSPQLKCESKIYRILRGGLGIPNIQWCGTEKDYNVMVMDLLGPSLEDLFNYCGRRFQLKTVLMLADQLLTRLEYIHTKSFIHRDIKPQNFLIGVGERQSVINIIDFGFAKKYLDSRTNQHIPFRENKKFTGTALYGSINAHKGIEQSRRDDLEALGYMLMYFIRGSLPWQGLLRTYTRNQKRQRTMECKTKTTTEQLCTGYPTEFRSYLEYCRSLSFEEKPDYDYLRGLFSDLFQRKEYEYDNMFDWTILNVQHERSKTSPERLVFAPDSFDENYDPTGKKGVRNHDTMNQDPCKPKVEQLKQLPQSIGGDEKETNHRSGDGKDNQFYDQGFGSLNSIADSCNRNTIIRLSISAEVF